jgi:hypothetical protein
MIHIHCNSISLVICHCLPWIRYSLEYFDGEILQCFIRALADSFVIFRTTTIIFVLLLGTHKLSSDVYKCQDLCA